MNENQAKERAARLLEHVKAGRTVFFKAGSGWDIAGPAADLQHGAIVTVTKANGSTTQVMVTRIMSDREVNGCAVRTALFTSSFTTTRPVEDEPEYDVVDRNAAMVGTALGRGGKTKRGSCHYCGLPLDRNGYCREC